jgi:hypothetical protein
MLNLRSLQEAKKLKRVEDSETENKFNQLYQRAINLIEQFVCSGSPELNILKEASTNLSEALEIDKTRPEPYLYLACIFYLLGKKPLALHYLKAANFINPDLKGLKVLNHELNYVSGQYVYSGGPGIKLQNNSNSRSQMIRRLTP